MIAPDDTGLVSEPFDPARHGPAALPREADVLDEFYSRAAERLAVPGKLRVYMLARPDGGLDGFYTLSPHRIDCGAIHGAIPAAFLTMMGAEPLLADALRRVARASGRQRLDMIVLDVFDDGDAASTAHRKRLYEAYGFAALSSDPLRLFLPVATIRTLLQAETGA